MEIRLFNHYKDVETGNVYCLLDTEGQTLQLGRVQNNPNLNYLKELTYVNREEFFNNFKHVSN